MGVPPGYKYGMTAEQVAELEDENSQLEKDAANKPKAMEYESLLDKNGNLPKNYMAKPKTILPEMQRELDKIQLNTDGLDAIRSRALAAPGTTSPWLKMQQDKLGLQTAQMHDDASASSGASNANAMSQLAMRGGLQGGSAERLAKQSARDLNMERQRTARFGADAGINLGIEDENTKNNMLMQLPGMELNALQPQIEKSKAIVGQRAHEYDAKNQAQQFNIMNQIGEVQGERGFDQNTYNKDMEVWGANNTALAQSKAGK